MYDLWTLTQYTNKKNTWKGVSPFCVVALRKKTPLTNGLIIRTHNDRGARARYLTQPRDFGEIINGTVAQHWNPRTQRHLPRKCLRYLYVEIGPRGFSYPPNFRGKRVSKGREERASVTSRITEFCSYWMCWHRDQVVRRKRRARVESAHTKIGNAQQVLS